MADLRLLPAGINDERGQVMLSLIERLGELDLSKALIYRLKNVADGLLLDLAWQFHVMGDEGWSLSSTDDQRLDLIKHAIQIHKYRGTLWAMQQAFASIGYPDVRIYDFPAFRKKVFGQEGGLFDGSTVFDGGRNFSFDFRLFFELTSRNWNEYHVELDIDPETVIDTTMQQRIARIAKLNAPARSQLLYVSYPLTLEWLGQYRIWDGSELFDGSHLFNSMNCALIALDPPASVGFGTGTTPVTPADTALQAQYLLKAIDSYTCDGELNVLATLTGAEAGAHATSEVGVFAASGALMGRATFAPKPLDSVSRIGFDLEFVF